MAIIEVEKLDDLIIWVKKPVDNFNKIINVIVQSNEMPNDKAYIHNFVNYSLCPHSVRVTWQNTPAEENKEKEWQTITKLDKKEEK